MVEVVGVHRFSCPVREHQAVIFPEGAEPQPFPVLADAVALEGFRGLRRELDRAAAPGALGGVERTVLIERPLHRLL